MKRREQPQAGHTGLMEAAFDHPMNRAFFPDQGPKRCLEQLVRRALRAPATVSGGVRIWAGDIQVAPRAPVKKTFCRHGHRAALGTLQGVIEALLRAEGQRPGAAELRRHAAACNALLDGLWLEGAMLPDHLPQEEITAIALRSIQGILGLPAASDAP
ncbi:hypothetical protein PSA7680_02713 [Pseudoruegeria aquimaris]|uniref:BetI-type transcriptional repressor C-terminal domain-containing protein n=1 Tax=Pseudoruegeria aquimaris TaxID=393663 RepID=A0A1Y5T048_9RHOB|nr:TetR family transcriptional regulator C-terminal domain-containing protein [Pseudoruegeria aquimaris]SLN52101.1 hypothetical protein PSA7680_02713 [Pseudoruegeria aquimaris]